MTKKKLSKNVWKSRPVVVTTAHRGVFVGHTDAEPTADECVLTDARMVVYYSADARGVTGIAVVGPGGAARVSPAVTRLGLRNVTSIADATPAAVAEWERGRWS